MHVSDDPRVGTERAGYRIESLLGWGGIPFPPGGPPALSSKKGAKECNEVKEIGSSTSTTRTTEQTLAARFWAEPPVQQARGSLRKLVLDRQRDISDAARFMASSGGRSPRSVRATRTATTQPSAIPPETLFAATPSHPEGTPVNSR